MENCWISLIINEDGSYEELLDISKVSNGVAGYNSDSVNICYKGGLKEITKDGKYIYGDTRTKAQKDAFNEVIRIVLEKLKKTQEVDDVVILGHRDLSKDLNNNGIIEEREYIKTCPTFNAMDMDEYGWIMGKKALERVKKGRKYY
ncbi:hypothetical protein CHU00_14830 [Sphingobacterium cellulitidis]|nr:hypothetical protein CHU00_14830 [Sphingobacterium cellulitidis]